jgi:hypothetical protein
VEPLSPQHSRAEERLVKHLDNIIKEVRSIAALIGRDGGAEIEKVIEALAPLFRPILPRIQQSYLFYERIMEICSVVDNIPVPEEPVENVSVEPVGKSAQHAQQPNTPATKAVTESNTATNANGNSYIPPFQPEMQEVRNTQSNATFEEIASIHGKTWKR